MELPTLDYLLDEFDTYAGRNGRNWAYLCVLQGSKIVLEFDTYDPTGGPGVLAAVEVGCRDIDGEGWHADRHHIDLAERLLEGALDTLGYWGMWPRSET